MNKKGAEMTIGTIVIIILALVVLVVIIYGFTVGWGNLWQNIIGFGGGDVNVQTVVQSCKVDCAVSNEYNYCTKMRQVVFEEGEDARPMTCDGLSKEPGTGLDCDRLVCVVQKFECASSELNEQECTGVDDCVTQWMNTQSMNDRIKDNTDPTGEDKTKRWLSITPITEKVSDTQTGSTCVVVVTNSDYEGE